MTIHRIALRHPWEVQNVGPDAAPQSEWRRINLPATLPLPAPGGAVHFRRPFHRPTGLEGARDVSLVLATTAGTPTATLNGFPLALTSEPDGSFRGPLLTYLAPRNVLIITFANENAPPGVSEIGITGNVCLEITPSA